MKSKKELDLHRLTRNNAWGGFIVFLVLTVIISMLMAATGSAFLSYVFESKIKDQYRSISSAVKVYDEGNPEHDSEIYEILDSKKIPYYILDENGEMIHSYGEIVRFNPEQELAINSLFDSVSYYTNADVGVVEDEDHNNTFISIPGFIKFVANYEKNVDRNSSLGETVFVIPLWIDTLTRDGTRHLFYKADLSVSFMDLSYGIVIYLAVIVLMVTVLIITFISALSNAIRKANTIRLLFTDGTTRGHNWLWFEYKGNPILRKKKNQNRTYAVVNIEMVRYANFCVCHSLAEGEAMLQRVSVLLEQNLMRNELSAHNSAASFALLLKYTDEEKIKKRVSHIIEQLQTISDEHKFNFQAGIAVVDIEKTGEVDSRKRMVIDIEREYHYASAAKDTLSGSADSGVAMLDDKLIEEQKWIDIVTERQQIALDKEEFVVYYQPKYDPKTDTLSGAEALIRWQSPEFGFVTPNRFIPIFEQNGFVVEIDHYMIRHVARDQKRWLDAGFKCVPISVNVSRAHFIEDDLAEQIRDTVDGEKCPHEYIEIELTESAFFDDKKMMLETINKLKEYGFAVSMDDFGSGYSSLNSLKDMPLDVLKLDAEFFRGEQGDGRGEIVVREAIKLAGFLNMRTVAEGVEHVEQVKFLREQGCDMIQGYYYAKPLPMAEYEERMKESAGKESAEGADTPAEGSGLSAE